MARKNVHTTYSSSAKNWRNVTEGASRPSKTYPTKQSAQEAGQQLAKGRGAEHFIHNKNGQIGTRNTYGHDPRKSQG